MSNKGQQGGASGLRDHIGYWLNRLRMEVHAAFERRLAEQDITVAQWNVLIALYNENATTPQELANFIGIDTGAITRLIDRVVAKNLVARAADPEDRRSFKLTLTDEGRALTPKLAAIADRNDAAFFNVLSPAERRQFKEFLGKLLAARGIEGPASWRR